MANSNAVPASGVSHTLLESWIEHFGRQFTSNGAEAPQLEWTTQASAALVAELDADGAVEMEWVEHVVHAPDQCRLWVGAPADVWTDLGARAGGHADPRDSFVALLNRTIAGVVESLAGPVRRQVANVEVRPCERPALPEDLFVIQVRFGEPGLPPLLLSIDAAFEALLEKPVSAPETRADPGAMDLLLDLEVPVSISFGRTRLPLKEVLNLAGGSIVELNRSINDLVDLVVDQRVVARGEVVVIDGNYGIRIEELVGAAVSLDGPKRWN